MSEYKEEFLCKSAEISVLVQQKGKADKWVRQGGRAAMSIVQNQQSPFDIHISLPFLQKDWELRELEGQLFPVRLESSDDYPTSDRHWTLTAWSTAHRNTAPVCLLIFFPDAQLARRFKLTLPRIFGTRPPVSNAARANRSTSPVHRRLIDDTSKPAASKPDDTEYNKMKPRLKTTITLLCRGTC